MASKPGYKALCGALLDIVMDLKGGEYGSPHCPPETACRGGDDGEACKACWQDAALARLAARASKGASLPDAAKQPYSRYGNVFLTATEYAGLCAEYGESRTARAIDMLALHIGAKGKDPYRSHNMALRKWVFKAIATEDAQKARAAGRFPSHNERNVDVCREWLNDD